MRAAAMAVMGVAVTAVAIILVAATEVAIIPMAAAIAQQLAIIPMAVSILVVTVTLAISTVACTIAVTSFTALSAELSVLDIIDPIVIVRITAIHLLLTMILNAVIGIAVNPDMCRVWFQSVLFNKGGEHR